jgi:hypothetical protein
LKDRCVKVGWPVNAHYADVVERVEALKLVTTRNRVGEKLGWLEDLVTSTNKRVEEYNKKVKAEEETKEAAHVVDEKFIRTELSRWMLRRHTG